ncbi:MAG: hypothetical protein FWH28_08710, partial [Clostridiales bacterium]|nr:hypothetical protein [Clostridiales bacterium]
YRAFVLEEVGEPAVRTYVVSTNNGTFETAGAGDPADYILFVSGTPQTVSLKHGQWLALVDAPEGSAIAIEEKGELGYTASYELMLNGGLTGTNSSREYTGIVKGAESGDHGFPPYSTVVPSGLTFQTAFIGEPLNWATFTNTYKYIPITGIAMDNMPYYILIGLAVLGFAAYVMVRLRRNARYATQPQAQTH